MRNEKDNLGDKLRAAEAALEDQWARQQDAELLEKIRKRLTSTFHCLNCGKTLERKHLGAIRVFACPEGHGAWLDGSALDSIREM